MQLEGVELGERQTVWLDNLILFFETEWKYKESNIKSVAYY